MDKKYIIAFLGAAALIFCFIVLAMLTPFLFPDYPFSGLNPGSFGDMFGSVNALFSGLAFAGFLVAMWMQYDQLSLQRQDLKIAVEEQIKSREEFEKQAKALEEQAQLNRQSLELNWVSHLESKKPFIVIESPDHWKSGNIYSGELHFKTLNHPFRILDFNVLGYDFEVVKLYLDSMDSSDYYPKWVFPNELNNVEIEAMTSIKLNLVLKKEMLSKESEYLDFNIRLSIQDTNGILYYCFVNSYDERGFHVEKRKLFTSSIGLKSDFLVLIRDD